MNNMIEKVEKGIATMKEVSLTILGERDMKNVNDALNVLKTKMISYIKSHPGKDNIVEIYEPIDNSEVTSVGLTINSDFTTAYITAKDFKVSFTKKNIENK